MESDVSGVRIIPSVLEFNDTVVNTVYRMNVTVKNVSKTSKSIRYYGPNTKNFTLKVKNPDKPVAPGLEVPAVVEFVTEENVQHNDRMVLTVDDDVIEIPLKGTPCQPQLVLEGPVDFGHVTANSKVIHRQVTLHNHGSKAGDFKIKYSGDKPITFLPSTGNVPPQSSMNIRVEYVTKLPGKFDETARVKLEGQESGTLHIHGTIVDGNLQLLDPQSNEHLSCIKFGATYYGTDCTQAAVLYNNGPEPVCFVTVLDEGAIGQELGTDLTKSTSGLLLEQTQNTRSGGEMNDLISLVTAIPNQGVLGPYQRVPIFFRFSPRWTSSEQGFSCTKMTPPRKDFAVFMHLKMVGASHGFQSTESHKKCNVEGLSLEIAVTGTALPVLLTLLPQTKFDFGECPVGEHVDQLCTLKNDSSCMPITYQLRRVAHYTAKPTQGKIKAGQGQNIIFSFAPSQAGTFRPHQYVDVLGQVADNRNPLLMHLQVIHSQPIQLIGRSIPVTIQKQPVFNPGITPKIANEVGLYVDSTVSSAQKTPAAALLGAQGTNLHHLKSSKDQKNQDDKTMVAFPNDRACSIRPSDRSQNYKTIFTRRVRHTYVDPDYAYTDEEQAAISAHKQYYVDFVEQLREGRRNKTRKKEFKENDNEVDIAIKPAAGLRPKKLKLPSKDETRMDGKRPEPPNKAFRLLSIKELAEAEKTSSEKVKDGLNAVPTTAKEKADCSRVLSPQELHQIVIGPPMIDFGQVCLRSVTQKHLNIVNNLDHHIHVVVSVECRELRQTSPLSQVVPPHSKATLPLIFESNSKGRFQRSLDYKINGFYKNHLTVFAEVVPVALELSTSELVLEPVVGLPLDAGRNWSTFDIFSGCIRGVVTLHNKLNHPAEFTWQPILGDRGTAFSIRPATGIVDAGQDLDCEVVFHPSYMAPEEGLFNLNVHTGNTLKLKCLAKMGTTNVQFMDRRIMFGQVPLHLTSTRTAMLKNNSLNHAYFQVLDPNPFPGLTVSPLHGVVPVGGTAEIKVHLTPNAIMKFDTRVQVSIRGWKTLELRMGGTVEPPCVDIDVESFNFGGVYCSSSFTTPFRLLNRTNTKACMEFDLSRYTDFSLDFPKRQNTEDYTFQLMNPGIYSVTLDPDEIVEGNLIFKPTEVASYDFIMPVTINQTGAPTPAPTPFPPTPAPSNKNSLPHIVNPRPQYITIATPRRKVIATGLRQPLTLSSNLVEFSLSPGVHQLSQSAGVAQSKGVLLVNNSDLPLKWTVDTSNANQVLEDGVFKFLHANGMPFITHEDGGIEGTLEPGETFSLGVLFCPNKPGHYNVTVPVIVNEDYDHPYQFLSLAGELKAARLWFDPMAIVLTPVPLMTEISTEFNLLAANYTKSTNIRVEVPEVECEDGSTMKPLSVIFLDGKEVKPCCGDEGHVEPFTLPCRATFKSPRPVSFNHAVYFIDDDGKRFPLTVAATADNCLMTCYPYVASSPSNHQIVCEKGATLKGRRTASRESVNVGEAILVPCASPVRPASRPSTTATSSNFEVSSSSYESSSQSNLSDTFSTPRDGALNKFTTESEQNSRGRNDAVSRQLGSAIFPEEDTEEGIFHTEVLLAVQRWFSSQGWPGGPHPISVPQSLRSGLSKKPKKKKVPTATLR